MATLHLHLLGEFRLESRDAPINQPTAPRVQALLAYLVLHRAAPQSRQQLAFLLWPDTTDAQARTNLRQLLHALKQALPQADSFVRSEGHTLQWRADAPCRLDVTDFEAALSRGTESERFQDTPAVRLALEQAVALYTGDLVPSCYDDWILPERERLRQANTGALEHLLLLLERQGEPRMALPYAQRLLRHDPLREETYRALMRLHAACGNRAMVRRVYQTCAAVLERELEAEPSVATRDAYAQALQIDASAPAELVTTLQTSPVRTNLPVQLTSFVGRERELAAVSHLLQTARLLTLTGPGGTGKTRLALEVATTVVDAYPQGIWLVELAPLTDPALVPQAVATALGVREQPGRSILDALLDYLRAKTLLLILDNSEHLIETCAQYTEMMLRAAPGVTILATSREPLGVAGETPYRVPPLSLPDPRRIHHLDSLGQNDCVRLFVERAATAYPPFQLTAKNAPAITQICVRLDGIPLALELAAARTRLLPPEQIAARLDDRFRLLTGGSRTALPRHQTLLALIEWSHELLSDSERVLLRRLAVFAGGFSLEAAQAVCGEGGGGLTDEALDTLAHLADKSLVEVDTSSEAAEGHFRLLETIRQYAREKLLDAGEAEAVRDRHLDYFLQFAEEAEPKLRGPEQLAWLERLEREHANLRTALAWALQSGASESALRLAGALYYFWESHGHFGQGQKWLDEALALAAREQSERIAAGEYTSTRAETAWRAKALFAAGRLRFAALFNPVVSRTMVEESLHLWRELGDKWWMAVALEHKGYMLTVEADFQTSRACLEEGVALAREVADRWPLARCLVRLASPLLQIDVAASHRMCEEGVATARSVGDRHILCHGLSELAFSYFLKGDLAAAAVVAEESWMEARAIGSVTYIFLSLFRLTVITCLQGDLAKGKGYCAEMLTVAREKGLDFGNALVLIPFAYVAIFSGQPQRGARLLGAVEGSFGQRGFKLASSDLFRRVHKQALEMARAQLAPATFETALQEGRALTLEQALALATEDADAPSLGA